MKKNKTYKLRKEISKKANLIFRKKLANSKVTASDIARELDVTKQYVHLLLHDEVTHNIATLLIFSKKLELSDDEFIKIFI